jgi:hypothetical protein
VIPRSPGYLLHHESVRCGPSLKRSERRASSFGYGGINPLEPYVWLSPGDGCSGGLRQQPKYA